MGDRDAPRPGPQVDWIDENHLVVGDTRFTVATVPPGLEPRELVIIKPPDLVRRYLEVLEAEQPAVIVELGVKEGGSTGLLALVAQPTAMLAIDLAAEVPTLLAQLAQRPDLDGRLRTAFGLDQSDEPALRRALDSHLPDEPIDLVIDDASHILGPTRASFEVLFPRLRPGGLYVIEDWSAECVIAAQLARELEGVPDLPERLASVNQIFHILNAPDLDLPDDVKDRLVAAAAALPSDAATASGPDALFRSLTRAAAHADVGAVTGTRIQPSRPLADLTVELTMIAATSHDVIAEIRIHKDWVVVRRGTADLPRDSFSLDAMWTDAFGYLS